MAVTPDLAKKLKTNSRLKGFEAKFRKTNSDLAD
jgi:hypothetical protein